MTANMQPYPGEYESEPTVGPTVYEIVARRDGAFYDYKRESKNQAAAIGTANRAAKRGYNVRVTMVWYTPSAEKRRLIHEVAAVIPKPW